MCLIEHLVCHFSILLGDILVLLHLARALSLDSSLPWLVEHDMEIICQLKSVN